MNSPSYFVSSASLHRNLSDPVHPQLLPLTSGQQLSGCAARDQQEVGGVAAQNFVANSQPTPFGARIVFDLGDEDPQTVLDSTTYAQS